MKSWREEDRNFYTYTVDMTFSFSLSDISFTVDFPSAPVQSCIFSPPGPNTPLINHIHYKYTSSPHGSLREVLVKR